MRELLKAVIPRSLREKTYPCRERLSRIPGHLAASFRLFMKVRVEGGPVDDLTVFEKQYRSQNGEDGIIAAIFAIIGTTNKFFVEFGVEDGMICNSRRLKEIGWRGLQMDPREPGGAGVEKEFVTVENVEELFGKYSVPREFDLLSIDIDGNDYWVWKAITAYHPRAVVIEYNATMPPPVSRTIPYDPKFRFDQTDYFGVSLAALQKLGKSKGYTLVGCDSRGVNAFFVLDSLVQGRFAPPAIEKIYRPFGPPHRIPPHAEGKTWVEI